MMPCPSPFLRPGPFSAVFLLAMLPVLGLAVMAGGALWALRCIAGPSSRRPRSEPPPPGRADGEVGEGI